MGGIGRCAVCRIGFYRIRPLFMEIGNMNANNAVIAPRAEAPNIRPRPARLAQPQNQRPALRIIILQRPPAFGVRANRPFVPERYVPPRRRLGRQQLQYRYVPPLGRVRNRQRTTRMVYNLLRCVVCGRTYHTNELPALASNDIICSFNCFRQI